MKINTQKNTLYPDREGHDEIDTYSILTLSTKL